MIIQVLAIQIKVWLWQIILKIYESLKIFLGIELFTSEISSDWITELRLVYRQDKDDTRYIEQMLDSFKCLYSIMWVTSVQFVHNENYWFIYANIIDITCQTIPELIYRIALILKLIQYIFECACCILSSSLNDFSGFFSKFVFNGFLENLWSHACYNGDEGLWDFRKTLPCTFFGYKLAELGNDSDKWVWNEVLFPHIEIQRTEFLVLQLLLPHLYKRGLACSPFSTDWEHTSFIQLSYNLSQYGCIYLSIELTVQKGIFFRYLYFLCPANHIACSINLLITLCRQWFRSS